MADQKISALTALAAADVAPATDVLPIVDTSVTTTKKVTVADLRTAMLSATALTNSLSGDVALNNTSNYFDGPTVAQGTTGTWFASGQVTVKDTAGIALFYWKLWDGTTVIASGLSNQFSGAASGVTISCSGYIASPAGNIRISVRDAGSTSGSILANDSGNSKDSTISVFRIG